LNFRNKKLLKVGKKIRRIFFGRPNRNILPDYVTIGRGTYGVKLKSFHSLSPDAPVTIGNFCSIAPEVLIFCKADNPVNLPSTYPFKTLLLHPERGNQDAITKGEVIIGHDVWVDARAMILSGVTIGNGAVIGAGALVAKDVPPYAIVLGVPGKIAKFRFSETQIDALQEIAWWDWPDQKIRSFEASFYGDIDAFIANAMKQK
jgi:acetyltransferase-like isoleucine patch superfamily enzyme